MPELHYDYDVVFELGYIKLRFPDTGQQFTLESALNPSRNPFGYELPYTWEVANEHGLAIHVSEDGTPYVVACGIENLKAKQIEWKDIVAKEPQQSPVHKHKRLLKWSFRITDIATRFLDWIDDKIFTAFA